MSANITISEMKGTISKLVAAKGNVSFLEIQNLPGGKGEYCVEMGGANVIYWHGLSEEAALAVQALRAEGIVHLVPTHFLTYLVEGACVSIPLAKSAGAIRRGYKKPHWLPVMLQPGRA